MTHFFSFITHIKSSKIVLSGEPDNHQPFGLNAEGLFIFYEIVFIKKKDF
jgi:hypothetical protein